MNQRFLFSILTQWHFRSEGHGLIQWCFRSWLRFTPLLFARSAFDSVNLSLVPEIQSSLESVGPVTDFQYVGVCNLNLCWTGYTHKWWENCLLFECIITDTPKVRAEGVTSDTELLTCTRRSSITYITATGALLLLIAAVHALHATAHWNTAPH